MSPENESAALRQSPAVPAAQPSMLAAPKELWFSEELLGDRREVLIKHGSEIYRLRRTRQGKLILYK